VHDTHHQFYQPLIQWLNLTPQQSALRITPNAIFIFVNPLYINSAVNFCHLTYHP
jgi:hypothetical protein